MITEDYCEKLVLLLLDLILKFEIQNVKIRICAVNFFSYGVPSQSRWLGYEILILETRVRVPAKEYFSFFHNLPMASRWLAAFGTGIATMVAAPVVAAALLGVIGFTTGGVAAGSIAAAVQSAVYGGATTGVFAAAQSAGAAGIATTTSMSAGALAGAATWLGTEPSPGLQADCA